MKLIGISLRRPNFSELTAAAVMATGLWLVVVGALLAFNVDIGKADAGALLVVAAWGSLSARLGIRVGHGHRHLLANVVVSAALLLIYQGAWAIAG
jgi:hypothetical protein